MNRIYCDKCEKEITDNDFRFEGLKVEIKQSLDIKKGLTPNLFKKQLHLCRECYNKTINI